MFFTTFPSSDPINLKIVPLLSQSTHPLPSGFAKDDLDALVNRIQFGGDEVVKAKNGAGSATLSMAYAGAEFAAKVIRALNGEKGIVAPTYVSVFSPLCYTHMILPRHMPICTMHAAMQLGTHAKGRHIGRVAAFRVR